MRNLAKSNREGKIHNSRKIGKYMEKLSQQDQQQVQRLQQMSQSLETIIQQRMTTEAQIKELDFAAKELSEAGEAAVVYKSAGGIFIKSDQKKLLADTKEKKETLDMRVKSLANQEQRLKAQYEELRKKVQEIFKGQGLG
jgi:prefoldin beta subunit